MEGTKKKTRRGDGSSGQAFRGILPIVVVIGSACDICLLKAEDNVDGAVYRIFHSGNLFAVGLAAYWQSFLVKQVLAVRAETYAGEIAVGVDKVVIRDVCVHPYASVLKLEHYRAVSVKLSGNECDRLVDDAAVATNRDGLVLVF